MTEEEIAALPWLNEAFTEQWQRYGLNTKSAPLCSVHNEKFPLTEEVANSLAAIRYHNLVTRYLDEYPEFVHKFIRRENGYMYYDILKMAEDKYLEGAYSGFELRKILGEKYDSSRN